MDIFGVSKLDLYSVTQGWQYCMGDTICYHKHLTMDTNLRGIKVQQKLYNAGKKLMINKDYEHDY